MHFTYIIYSDSYKQFYVGSTQDVEERLRRHNAGHSKSTKGKGPWTLIKSFSFETRSEAMQLEKKIKKRGIRRFLEDMVQPG
jgi:putative endonuclease